MQPGEGGSGDLPPVLGGEKEPGGGQEQEVRGLQEGVQSGRYHLYCLESGQEQQE